MADCPNDTIIQKYPDFLELKRHCFSPENTDELKVFKVQLYVRQFRSEEVSTKVVDSQLIVHGRHEEHVDLHGFTSREFKWRCHIPDEYDPRSTSTTLLPNGILKIFVYRKDHWEKFLSEERKFVVYVNLRPYVFQNFSFAHKDGTITLKASASVKIGKDTVMGISELYERMLSPSNADPEPETESFELDEKYFLPSDIDPDTVVARLSHLQMLEVRGSRLPTPM